MNVILVARNAFEAYLINSAVRRPVNRIGVLVDEQRPVQFAHDLTRALVIGADHDTIRVLEVLDGRPLAQELRVRHDDDVAVVPQLRDGALDLISGPDRHRRFGDDKGLRLEVRRNLARRGEYEREIRKPVAAPGRRPDGDHHHIGRRNGRIELGGEGQPAGFDVAFDEILKPVLEDRNFAALEPGDLGCVLVDTCDDVAEIGKTGAGDETDIAGADDGYVHEKEPSENF